MSNNISAQHMSLDEVYEALNEWRRIKKYGDSNVPENLWKPIFELAKKHTDKKIRSLLDIKKPLYDESYRKLFPKKEKVATESSPPVGDTSRRACADITQEPVFCEAKVTDPTVIPPLVDHSKTNATTQKTIKTLRSKDDGKQCLDYTTIIVECTRPDGHRLSIHTTTKTIKEVMTTFLNLQLDELP